MLESKNKLPTISSFCVIAIASVLIILSLSTKVFASEDDLYDFLWLDPDKKVYVLQNKVYKKKNDFYANLSYVKNSSSDFQSTSGVHFSFGYYFHEEFAVEAIYHQYNNSNNDNFENIRKINKSTAFTRRPQSKYGLIAVYSPFYGKINTFNKIIYLDWSFGFGIGQIQTESNALSVASSSQADLFQDEKNTAILAKTALKIHVTQSLHFNIEYHRDMYRAPGPKVNDFQAEKWRANPEFVLGLGFSF